MPSARGRLKRWGSLEHPPRHERSRLGFGRGSVSPPGVLRRCASHAVKGPPAHRSVSRLKRALVRARCTGLGRRARSQHGACNMVMPTRGHMQHIDEVLWRVARRACAARGAEHGRLSGVGRRGRRLGVARGDPPARPPHGEMWRTPLPSPECRRHGEPWILGARARARPAPFFLSRAINVGDWLCAHGTCGWSRRWVPREPCGRLCGVRMGCATGHMFVTVHMLCAGP